MKKIIVISVLAALLGFGFTSINPINKNRQAKNPRHAKLIETLKLNDTQLAKFNEYHFQHEEEVIDLKSDIEKNRIAMRKLMLNKNFDENQLRSLVKSNSDLQAKMKNSMVEMWINIYNILDDSQKDIWKDHLSNMGFNSGRRGHGMRGHGMRGPENRGMMWEKMKAQNNN